MAQFPLIDQASLVMIPGAYKEGKIYSQLPTDGSGDFTFTRGTDTATRVNENGLIEKERVNLLLQSNQFDTSPWVNYLINTPTSGQKGYDGSSDAWLVECKSTSNFGGARQLLSSSGVNVFSFYAKRGSTNFVGVFIDASSSGNINFELTGSGSVGNVWNNGLFGAIERVGTSDWYRCSFVFNDNLSDIRVGPRRSIGSFNSDVGDTIYIQDAQLEQGLVATDYIETTTAPVYAGLTDNMPRLDYTDATCPSLLLEPSRTNLVTQSEYFEGAGWSSEGNNGVIITANQTTSPEGLINAFKIQGGGASNDRAEFRLTGFPSNSALYSVFIKGTGESTTARIFNTRTGSRIDINISSSNILTLTNLANISKYDIDEYENGWYRVWGEFETIDGATNYFQLYPSLGGTESVYFWGAQVELGSYPTSYIPTYGSTQTRAADVSSVTKAVSSEGSLFINVGGTSQPKLSVLGEYFDASTTENKVAIAYSSTALVISHNGSIVVDKTGTYDVSSLTQIQLGHSNGSDQADSPISEFVTFDSFLTNSELNALTQ